MSNTFLFLYSIFLDFFTRSSYPEVFLPLVTDRTVERLLSMKSEAYTVMLAVGVGSSLK